MKTFLNKIRAFPDDVNYKDETLYVLAVAGAGLLIGFISKATDSISLLGTITSEFGIWIFISVLFAVFSRTPVLAAISMPVFFISMLAAYYAYGYFFLGFSPKSYAIGWLIIAVLSPLGGFLMWYARSDNIISSILVSLPAGALLALGYPAFYTYKPHLILDMFCALVLIFLLPKSKKQKLIAAGISIVFGFMFAIANKYFGLL